LRYNKIAQFISAYEQLCEKNSLIKRNNLAESHGGKGFGQEYRKVILKEGEGKFLLNVLEQGEKHPQCEREK